MSLASFKEFLNLPFSSFSVRVLKVSEYLSVLVSDKSASQGTANTQPTVTPFLAAASDKPADTLSQGADQLP